MELIHALKQEPASSCVRFWITRALEAFLRGETIALNQAFLLEQSLVEVCLFVATVFVCCYCVSLFVATMFVCCYCVSLFVATIVFILLCVRVCFCCQCVGVSTFYWTLV